MVAEVIVVVWAVVVLLVTRVVVVGKVVEDIDGAIENEVDVEATDEVLVLVAGSLSSAKTAL
jgi:hypothetical protein